MRKTSIALLVAVVSSPLAMAESYYYDPYYQDTNDTTVTDSFNKDIDKTLTVNYDKDLTVKDSFNQDNDYMSLYDVNNKDIYKFTDNSKYNNDQDWSIDIDENYFVATSYLDGAVTYSDVTYGAACCDYGYHDGYGEPAASTVNVVHRNTMSNAFTGASGINIAGQNAGNNSLVQQSASTNALITGAGE